MAKRKKLFITMLEDDSALGATIARDAARYGVETCGVTWREEPGKPIWGDVAAMILKEGCDGWLVAGKGGAWSADAARRSHMALAAVKAANLMGDAFSFFAMIDPEPASLPTPFAAATAVTPAKLGVRLAAKLGLGKKSPPDYFLDAHPLPAGDGVVLELGAPKGGVWAGALLATAGAGEISHHTVGPRGTVPERGIVEYALKGVKLEANGREYTGWGLSNRLDEGTSYFVRIAGETEGLLFGPLPTEDSTELYSLSLAGA